jgi:nucleotide-binding universal stress UspA family protein
MITRILYATDGSEAALAGAHLLVRLALTAEHEVRVLTVLPEADEGDGEAPLSTARDVLQNTAASVQTEVFRGSPAPTILRAERSRPTDLIVVGTRGPSALEHAYLGSVAETVARSARRPVLVARPLVHDLRQAILGYDGSEAGARTVAWLPRFPLPPECALHIETVLSLPGSPPGYRRREPSADPHTLYEKQRREVETRLVELVRSRAGAGRPWTSAVVPGDPVDTLLATAKERRADLIILGAPGLSARGRYLMGNVAENVLRRAPCSVLIVK